MYSLPKCAWSLLLTILDYGVCRSGNKPEVCHKTLSHYSVTVHIRTYTYTHAQFMSNIAAHTEMLKPITVLKYLTNLIIAQITQFQLPIRSLQNYR